MPILRGMAAAQPNPDLVESLNAAIERLQRERQQLRAEGADSAALESNRCELARAQQQLSQALIRKFTPAAA